MQPHIILMRIAIVRIILPLAGLTIFHFTPYGVELEADFGPLLVFMNEFVRQYPPL